jgi:hypothetical protein
MRPSLRSRRVAVGATLLLALGPLAACTAHNASVPPPGSDGATQLIGFNTCADALAGLRGAAKEYVGPYGFNSFTYDGPGVVGVVNDAAPVPLAAGNGAGPAAAAPGSGVRADVPDTTGTTGYSTTNNQEVGVDEPDLVKTDGKRIYAVSNGVVSVVDAATKTLIGSLDLADPSNGNYRPYDAQLLVFGDHALALTRTAFMTGGAPGAAGNQPGPMAPGGVAMGGGMIPAAFQTGSELVLLDLSGAPVVLSRMRITGSLVDARQTGSTVRVVIRSAPRFQLPALRSNAAADRVIAYRSVIDRAALTDWLPQLSVTTGSSTTTSTTACPDIVRPSSYSGTNLLTILSLDLGASDLTQAAPLSIVADGDTVYSSGTSLYVASDGEWRYVLQPGGTLAHTPTSTAIYRFDTSRPGLPSFVASGTVPGHLVNQYAMSERGGDLRVASTTGDGWGEPTATVANSQSGVYVLRPNDGQLDIVGKVEGLGRGERIYAVRFLDSTAYVVTFRQTDPLYVVDLSNPTQPAVRGELLLTGYSSYLHPTGDGRLIGVGQDVNAQVRRTGLQLSLFRVSSSGDPTRLSVYQLPGGSSQAEFDPHAFLYWAPTGLLVVPIWDYVASGTSGGGALVVPPPTVGRTAPRPSNSSSVAVPPTAPYPLQSVSGVLLLHVSDTSLNPIGLITQPSWNNPGGLEQIERSLIIDGTLWTLSTGALMASNPETLDQLAYVPIG